MKWKCIFCSKEFDPKKVSPEHIIPGNIGGTVVTYQVCDECNTFFSSFDAELHRHRNIYDAYHSIQAKTKRIEFRFLESHVDFENGTKVKTVPKSSSRKIVTTKLGEGEFVCSNDCDEKNDPAIGHMRKIAIREKIPTYIPEEHLAKYLDFKKKSNKQDVFKDERFHITASRESSFGQEINLMNAKTPHRFVAKACAEFAHLMECATEIANIDLIKKHALQGGLEGKQLHFYQDDMVRKDGLYYHVIFFTEKQFKIAFFSKFGVAIDITWRSHPRSLIIANDLVKKKLFYCEQVAGGVMKTDRLVSIKLHETLRLHTNI